MPITIRGDDAPAAAATLQYISVNRKKSWSDSWRDDFSIIPDDAELHMQSHGISRCVGHREYGRYILEHSTSTFEQRDPFDLTGHWLRIMLFGQNPERELWRGIIEKQQRIIDGTSDDGAAQGTQKWIAYGPERILQKLDIYHSYCYQPDGTFRKVEFTIDFNALGQDNSLKGNRSSATVTPAGEFQSYGFSRTGTLWTNYQIIEYLLARFVNKYSTEAPTWVLAGQVEPLKQITTFVRVKDGDNIFDLFSQLIQPRYGLDWKITPTKDEDGEDIGLVINVVSLAGEKISYGDYTIPRNPIVCAITASIGAEWACDVEEDHEQKFDRIEVIGERIRTCFSLSMAAPETLMIGWSPALQVLMMAETYDKDRKHPRYQDVFRRFVIKDSPATGDASILGLSGTQIAMGDDGSIKTWLDEFLVDGRLLTGQFAERRTLAELPLFNSIDYSTEVPTDYTLAQSAPEFLKPFAVGILTFADGSTRYIMLHEPRTEDDDSDVKAQNVHVLDDEIGILLSGDEPLYNGRNHCGGLLIEDEFDPDTDTSIDYDTIMVTLAIEEDFRCRVAAQLPAIAQTGNGLTKVIRVPNAHCWYLAPNTVLGIDPATGTPQYRETGLVLRNDADILLRTLAGEMARFLYTRIRATATRHILTDMTPYLGAFVKTIDGAGDLRHIGAIVTSVNYHFSENGNSVSLSTGYSQRSATR